MIILNALGQTCNKFFTYLHYLGDSIETGEKIIVLAPDITMKDFPNIQKSEHIKFPLYSEILSKILGYKFYINTLRTIFANKYSLKLINLILKGIPNTRLIVAPTNSNKSKNYLNHLPELKNIFTPNQEIVIEVDSLFKTIRKNYKIICGVHIRHGDYKTWREGKYYYSIEEFNKIMKRVAGIFPNHEIIFFISSNEKINLSKFSDITCFSINNSTAVKDLYGLGICDYIIGPPSTYSGWASFYGETPIYFIENPDDEINITSLF